MAYSLIVHHQDQLGTNGGTSTAINTTGSDLILLAIATDVGVTLASGDVSDSASNTWTLAGGVTYAAAFERIHLFYAKNAATSASHTFTVTKTSSFANLCSQGWSGSHLTAPDDQHNGNSVASSTTIQTGSITPSQANCLVVSAINPDIGGTMSIDSSMTISDQGAGAGSVAYGVAAAYIVQTSASAINPTWTNTLSKDMAAGVWSFLPAASTSPFKAVSGSAPQPQPSGVSPQQLNLLTSTLSAIQVGPAGVTLPIAPAPQSQPPAKPPTPHNYLTDTLSAIQVGPAGVTPPAYPNETNSSTRPPTAPWFNASPAFMQPPLVVPPTTPPLVNATSVPPVSPWFNPTPLSPVAWVYVEPPTVPQPALPGPRVWFNPSSPFGVPTPWPGLPQGPFSTAQVWTVPLVLAGQDAIPASRAYEWPLAHGYTLTTSQQYAGVPITIAPPPVVLFNPQWAMNSNRTIGMEIEPE